MRHRPFSHAAERAIPLALLIVSALLIYHRGGGLAWFGLLLAVGLLVKAWRRPSARGWLTGLNLVAVWALAWPAVFYYVISTWETGEVVELSINTTNGNHTVRTWIMESPDSLIVYYDAPIDAATALLANAPLSLARDGASVDVREYSATLADDLSRQRGEQVIELMSKKYGDRNTATDVYYGLLGQPKDKTGVVIEFPR